MARMRYVERALAELWEHGLVPGEMHLGIGEEAAIAGVLLQLSRGDATATDHRSTPVLVGRGVDPLALLLESVGDPGGLHRGRGGHMHLFAPDLPSSSDGIVGSSGPYACGYAMAAQQRKDGTAAVAFFGEGAANQGMMLEAWNLAVAWRLPVLFVCKDNGWAITTRSSEVTGGRLTERAAGFGLKTASVDGTKVAVVHDVAGGLLRSARDGEPAFLHVRVYRPQGHFLGDPLLRLLDHPLHDGREVAPGLIAAARAQGGAGGAGRAHGAGVITARLAVKAAEKAGRHPDPVELARAAVPAQQADAIDRAVRHEVVAALRKVIAARGAPAGTADMAEEVTW